MASGGPASPLRATAQALLGLVAGAALLVAAGFDPGAVVPLVVLSLPFAWVMGRRPVLRRLAVRNALRRPRETLLILLGALLGTAIITGSAIVGDTLGESIRRGAFTKLGPVDVLVRTDDLEARDDMVRALRDAPGADVDGVLAITRIGVAVATPGADRRAEPSASLLELDFGQGRRFGDDEEATGLSGATPAPGRAAIGEDLARTLEVGAGDAVEVYAYGGTLEVEVDRVLPRLGLAGFREGFGSESPNLFVTPGTIARLAGSQPGAGAPPTALVAVSGRGDVVEGADRTDAVTRHVTRRLDAAGLGPVEPDPVKRDLLEAAEEQGASFTELFSSIGFFSVIAGILLLVSIFVMLAEERKTELGMLRAVGLKRSGLVGSFSLEGWMYSLGSAALGTVAGIGVGRAIVFVTARIFGGAGQFSLELRYTATMASLERGFLTGFVMSLLTVVATSVSISRLNVIRAIRDLPEPTDRGHRHLVLRLSFWSLVALAGVLTSLNGVANEAPAPVLIGPSLVALGAAAVLRTWLNRRVVDTVAAVAVLLWAVFCFDVLSDVFDNPEIYLFVVDGVLLTVSAVVLVSRHQALIGAALRRLGGGSRSMALRLGLAYPLARSFRTSIILMTFALTMYTLASITIFSGVFNSQVDEFTADVAGGFDVLASSNPSNPATTEALEDQAGVTSVASLASVNVQFRLPAASGGGTVDPDFQDWGLTGFDAGFVAAGPPGLQEVLPRFEDEEAAWRGVLADPSLVIVDEFFLQGEGGPPEESIKVGDRVVLRDLVSGTVRNLRVAALAESGLGFTPAYQGIDAVRDLVGPRAVAAQHYIATDPSVDAQEVADRLNGRFLRNGLDATSFEKLVADGLAIQEQFFRLMQGYLALGLVVGVAGLGVVMVRAVRERRREVGVLRSLGFDPRQVRRAFVAEASFVALEGIFVGTGLALVSSWRLFNSGAFGDGLDFTVPWDQMAVVLVLAFVATLAATITPAQQASKIRPAVALRITD